MTDEGAKALAAAIEKLAEAVTLLRFPAYYVSVVPPPTQPQDFPQRWFTTCGSGPVQK